MIRLLTLVGFYFIIIIVLIKIKRQLLTQKELVTTCNLSILKSLRSSQISTLMLKIRILSGMMNFTISPYLFHPDYLFDHEIRRKSNDDI